MKLPPNVPTEYQGRQVIWAPNEGPQQDFLSCEAFEVLTGGARGGGKSEALIMDALGQVEHPEYRGIFFRLTYPDLAQLIERTQRRYPLLYPDAKWNNTEKTWTFPSGAKLIFRYLKNENDWTHYQGHEYHWMGFEELTQFSETQYLNLIPSCRTSVPGIKCFVRATTNPGNLGHNWVKARFIDPYPVGGKVIKEYVRDPHTMEIKVRTRAFFPSTFRDNPQLLEADPDYVLRLMMLPEADRKAMMDGDWDAYIGNVFRFSPGIHRWKWADFKRRFKTDRIPKHWKRYRAMDWGYAKPFSIQWFAVEPDSGMSILYREWYGVKTKPNGEVVANEGVRLEPRVVAQKIKDIEKAAGEWDNENDMSLVTGVADPAMWNKQAGDTGGGPSIMEKFNVVGVYFNKGKNDRIPGKQSLHDYLYYQMDADNQYLVVAPALVVIEEEAIHTLRTVPALEYDKTVVEDINTDMEDHAYDSLRYYTMSRPLPVKVMPNPRTGRLFNNTAKGESPWTP